MANFKTFKNYNLFVKHDVGTRLINAEQIVELWSSNDAAPTLIWLSNSQSFYVNMSPKEVIEWINTK